MSQLDLLFIAGIPASGKTHFCKWLATNHGYIHIDAEVPNRIDEIGLRQVWDKASMSSPPDCVAFAEAVLELRKKFGKPTVFDWGFPPNCLEIASALKRAGFSSWWFEADNAAARAEYSRNGRPIASFDNQLRAINSNREKLMMLFTPHVVMMLDSNGVRLKPEAAWSAMGTEALEPRWQWWQREIFDAFTTRRRDKQPVQIKSFIQDAASFANALKVVGPLRSAKAVDASLARVGGAAAALIDAYGKVDGEARIRLEDAARSLGQWTRPEAQYSTPKTPLEAKMQQHAAKSAWLGYHYDLTLMAPEELRRRLEAYAGALVIHSEHARSKVKVSTGSRVAEDLAVKLVCFLFERWTLSFGKSPSKRRGGEFQNVAAIVGRQFKLSPLGIAVKPKLDFIVIGPTTPKKAKFV
jgi:hypothetical protein